MGHRAVGRGRPRHITCYRAVARGRITFYRGRPRGMSRATARLAPVSHVLPRGRPRYITCRRAVGSA